MLSVCLFIPSIYLKLAEPIFVMLCSRIILCKSGCMSGIEFKFDFVRRFFAYLATLLQYTGRMFLDITPTSYLFLKHRPVYF
jgi:hypothetical protein